MVVQEVVGVLRPRHDAHRPHPRLPLRQDGGRLQVCPIKMSPIYPTLLLMLTFVKQPDTWGWQADVR